MNVAMLVVEGSLESLESLRSVLALDCEGQWKKGDRRRSGRIHEASGFNVTIADAATPSELLELIRAFLAFCKEKNVVFSSHSLSAEISIGFTVGDSHQFVAGVDFTPTELLSFAECGIKLSITAYPTSDEANADEIGT